MLKKGYSLTETLVSLVIVGTVMAGALPVISVKMKLNEETINGQQRGKTWTRTANDNGIYYNEGLVGINVDKDFIREDATSSGGPKYRLTIGTPGSNNTLNFLNPGFTSTKPLPADGSGVKHSIGAFSVSSPAGIPTDTNGYTSMKFYDENYVSDNGVEDPDWETVDGSEEDLNFDRLDELGIPYEGTIQYYRYRIKEKLSEEEQAEVELPPTWDELSQTERDNYVKDYLRNTYSWSEFWINWAYTNPIYVYAAKNDYIANVLGGDTDGDSNEWSEWSSWNNHSGDVCLSTYSDSTLYKCESYYVFSAPRTKSNVVLGGNSNVLDYSSYATIIGGQYNKISYGKFSVIYNSIGGLIEDSLQCVLLNNNQTNGVSMPNILPAGYNDTYIKKSDNCVIANSNSSHIDGTEADHIENSVIINGQGSSITSNNAVIIDSSSSISGENSVIINGSTTSTLAAENVFVGGKNNNIYDAANGSSVSGNSNTLRKKESVVIGSSNYLSDINAIAVGTGNNTYGQKGIKVGKNLQENYSIQFGFEEEKIYRLNEGNSNDEKENQGDPSSITDGIMIKSGGTYSNPVQVDKRKYYKKNADGTFTRDPNGNYIGLDYNLRNDGHTYAPDDYYDRPAMDMFSVGSNKGDYDKVTSGSWTYLDKAGNKYRYVGSNHGDYVRNGSEWWYKEYRSIGARFIDGATPRINTNGTFNDDWIKRSNGSYEYVNDKYILYDSAEPITGIGNYMDMDGVRYSRIGDILAANYTTDLAHNQSIVDQIGYVNGDMITPRLTYYYSSSYDSVFIRQHRRYVLDGGYRRYVRGNSLAKFNYHSYYGLDYDYRSDIRLKTILGKYDSGLNELLNVQPLSFKFKKGIHYDDIDTNKTYEGFIAQEVQKYYPDVVDTDEKGYLKIENVSFFDQIVLSLINSAKEMNAKCEKLKTKNDKIKEDIKLIEQKIKELEK